MKRLQAQVRQRWHMQVCRSRYAGLTVDVCGDGTEGGEDDAGTAGRAQSKQIDGSAGGGQETRDAAGALE
jgi:hypothetical protein